LNKQEEATPTQQQLTSVQQQYQQMFSQLSIQFKTPLRNIMGESEEAVQNTISNLLNQIIQSNNALKNLNEKVERLEKLCTDNHISFMPKSLNRTERRALEKKQAKK